jgi:activator of HSP90 ATPase
MDKISRNDMISYQEDKDEENERKSENLSDGEQLRKLHKNIIDRENDGNQNIVIAATTTVATTITSTSIKQNKSNNKSNKAREISCEMSGNPLLNQILDSKSSRQSTCSKKVPMARNKDFLWEI